MPAHLSILRRVTAEQLGPNATADLSVWLFFQLAAGHVFLPLLVATFLTSRTVARRPTVINVCCTWIMSSIASCLLLYAGKESGPEPSEGLCIAQSALLSGVLPMTSVACLAMVCSLWSSLDHPEGQDQRQARKGRLMTTMLMGAPYLALAMFLAIGAKLGTVNPAKVSREERFFYCSIDSPPFSLAVAIFSMFACIAATAIYVRLCLGIWRSGRGVPQPSQMDRLDIAFCLRVGLFTGCMLIATTAKLIALGDPETVFPDMFAASVGMAVFVIFGSQQGVLRVWLSWRSRRQSLGRVPSSPRPPRAPYPSFDLDLMKRTDSDVSEKARLEALHAYYSARARVEGSGVVIIDRPENAFLPGRDHVRASGNSGRTVQSNGPGIAL